jgi:hypothetical protein
MYNRSLPQECDKVENLEVTGAATAFCLIKKIVKCFVPRHIFAQSPLINIQSKLRTPDLCKNVSFVAMVIHTQSLRSQMCAHIHISFKIWRRWSGKRNKKLGQQ